MLTMSESLHSLNHWKTSFRTYYRRDSYFKAFLLPDATWDPSATNYGQTEDTQEVAGMVRSALDKGEDLRDFLNTLAGYLPFPYLTEKIVTGSNNLKNVWDTIYDHYGVNITSESLLDYVSISRNSGETYRQFFDRLLSHARLHLPAANILVDGINSGPTGENMTIALMNFVAMDWLVKINPQLIQIVKTEYSRELRENVQLVQLVPRIAINIDAMLARHDMVSNVNKLCITEETVDKVNAVRHNPKYFNRKMTNKPLKKKPFCPECQSLAKKLRLDVNFHHFPVDCPRPRPDVHLLQTEDIKLEENSEVESDFEGKIIEYNPYITLDINQTKSEDYTSLNTQPMLPDNVLSSDNFNEINYNDLYTKVLRIEQKQSVRKECSPQLRTKIGCVIADSIIDEGSELNCICSSIAAKCNIQFNPVQIKAMAAGSNSMKLLGVVPHDVELLVYEVKVPIKIVLRNAVIVKNLGPNVLIGEPAKMDNNIRTLPKEKLIKLQNIYGETVQLPYRSHSGSPQLNYQAFAVRKNIILYPGDEMHIPIQPSMQCDAVNVTPRKQFNLCQPFIANAKKGYANIKNSSENIVMIPKHSHVADLRTCTRVETKLPPEGGGSVNRIYDISRNDLSHFIHPLESLPTDENHLNEISLDPDDQMPVTWKNEFKSLCHSFRDIITPIPGRYNGAFGQVSTDINFTSTPPSTLKTYLPKYSHEMMQTLGKKMDVLESWGVLRKPEDLGIIPEFVMPSMLTPKPEENQFRLVTDFTSLNKYIKKLPTVSPSIQDAKQKIAKFKYHVFLDLSNYYYQGGIKIEDSQYLATVHPFKGLMVYTVEPQGLLNSGEHAYERLARIYGDMCSDERMTRMADGIYVLGNTFKELYDNLYEVFKRAQTANLTFKPSKIIICPRDTILFGWRKSGTAWIPTQHTTLPLVNATCPLTVKQLRSWIGAYKQLSACIKNYAIPLTRLEKLTGSDKSSSTRIEWTEELRKDFETAKQMINKLECVHTPTPDDVLNTYSDYSEEHKAVGGKLIIIRQVEGKKTKLNGGFFSARLNGFQTKWLPCEGESLACKLVLDHFRNYIRENKNVVHHFTDSLPCVHAFKRARMGAFSTSARISTFLTTLNSLNVEIHHKAGKDIQLVDYISRHPNSCSDIKCQICKFVNEQVKIGDNTAKLNSIQIQDVLSGKLNTPFLQRKSWLNAQQDDKTHTTLRKLIETSQAPDKKKTKSENTKLKLLFNLYKEGRLKLHNDGLITVNYLDPNGDQYQAISVPSVLFPGLIHALHLKMSHPSKLQLTKLVSRHFYMPGYQRVIEEVSNSCETCTAVKKLPKELLSESTGKIDGFATNFSADVIERHGQQILIVREKLSSFTMTKFITDQKAETIKTALITLILDLIPSSGTTVQVDCATSWAALENQSKQIDSNLQRLNIKIELGRHHNKNKNPVSDNACKEFHKEILRVKPDGTALTDTERAIITSNMNRRIRESGLSSREICFQRDLITNELKQVNDKDIAENIITRRERRHKKPNQTTQENIRIGHNVFLKNDISKLRSRELYLVVDIFTEQGETWATIQKRNSQFRAKKYSVKTSELLLLPGQQFYENEDNDEDEDNANLDSEDSNSTGDRRNTQGTDDEERHQSYVKPRRTTRQAAIRARQKIATMNRVQSITNVNKLPTHGWDYALMLELDLLDDDESTLLPETDHDSYSIQSSRSPSDEEDYTSDSSQEETTHTIEEQSSPTQPPAPSLPIDLLSCQRLTDQLDLPDVREAVTLGTEAFKHGEVLKRRRSLRTTTQPGDYALYHSTGERVEATRTGGREKKSHATTQTKP